MAGQPTFFSRAATVRLWQIAVRNPAPLRYPDHVQTFGHASALRNNVMQRGVAVESRERCAGRRHIMGREDPGDGGDLPVADFQEPHAPANHMHQFGRECPPAPLEASRGLYRPADSRA